MIHRNITESIFSPCVSLAWCARVVATCDGDLDRLIKISVKRTAAVRVTAIAIHFYIRVSILVKITLNFYHHPLIGLVKRYIVCWIHTNVTVDLTGSWSVKLFLAGKAVIIVPWKILTANSLGKLKVLVRACICYSNKIRKIWCQLTEWTRNLQISLPFVIH